MAGTYGVVRKLSLVRGGPFFCGQERRRENEKLGFALKELKAGASGGSMGRGFCHACEDFSARPRSRRKKAFRGMDPGNGDRGGAGGVFWQSLATRGPEGRTEVEGPHAAGKPNWTSFGN